jgi:hypothetical protein
MFLTQGKKVRLDFSFQLLKFDAGRGECQDESRRKQKGLLKMKAFPHAFCCPSSGVQGIKRP